MAPASVGIDSFPNKKPKLAGNVISDLTITQSFPVPGAGTCSGDQLDFETIGSTSVTINHAINELFIKGQARFNLSSSSSMNVRIIRDGDTGDVIASLNTGVSTSGTWILSTTLINESVGAHTYQWQILSSQPGENSCVTNTTFYNILSEANDTHFTKNTNIING